MFCLHDNYKEGANKRGCKQPHLTEKGSKFSEGYSSSRSGVGIENEIIKISSDLLQNH